MTRAVVWFSCGAASALAAKMTLRKYSDTKVAVAYCDTGSEHSDNERFLLDCERWFDHPVTRLKSDRYANIDEVFEKRRYLSGPKGALCTTELKKMLRFAFQRPDDVQVFGYTAEEQGRADRFREQNFEVTLETPLIEAGLSKADCLAAIREVGIELPAMYKLGYRNNNCIGCVKGGAGYWNKIRVDFPEVFLRRARQEREIGATILRRDGARLFLDELEPGRGRYEAEEDIECSLLCHGAVS